MFNQNEGNEKEQKTEPEVEKLKTPINQYEQEEKKSVETGRQYQEAQDRIAYVQKKLVKNSENQPDQQYQPVENYPPYNPLTANKAESYGGENTKSSYDVYGEQNPVGNQNGQNQEPYPYPDLTYDSLQTKNQGSYDLTNDDGSSWTKQNIHPVYNPWKSLIEKQPSKSDPYQSWMDDSGSTMDNVDAKQPWTGKIPLDSSFPVYPLHDAHPPTSEYIDSHEIHEIEHHVEHNVDEDRVSKRPYSYYFLGRKLWYIPLIFSVYFIIYVGALVLKSVARHKIQFPEKLWALHDEPFGHLNDRKSRKIDEITEKYESAVEKIKYKFM